MKAKIRKTGEIINIADYAKIDLDICNSFGNPISMSPEEIELLQESTDNIDWEQRRYEIAKAVIPGILGGCIEDAHIWANYHKITGTQQSKIAKYAISYADALIEELKKK